jgi:hypothetical protein
MKKQQLLSSSPPLSVTTSDYRHCCCFCCWLFSQPSYCTSTPSSSLCNIITPSLKLIKKDPSHLKSSPTRRRRRRRKKMKFFSVKDPRYLVLFGAAEGKETQAMTPLLCTEKKFKKIKIHNTAAVSSCRRRIYLQFM